MEKRDRNGTKKKTNWITEQFLKYQTNTRKVVQNYKRWEYRRKRKTERNGKKRKEFLRNKR